jgi:arabinose-5-phosphate isomerase
MSTDLTSIVATEASELALARRVIETEADAVRAVAGRLDGRFTTAVALLHACRGRVIISGMGKSGIIGRKIAATLSSTGTPAYFLHPAEAIHGDLGLITPDDVVIGMSQSGETAELVRVLGSSGHRCPPDRHHGRHGIDAGAGRRRR